ncbi:hypothetical protein N5P18_05810 [Janibacter terrae]|jgi:hypothetical protein|uniref:PknH-like extracellular domain-containing protein n=1 Tax=Janibacter terrae TaxID=103817 RepID=A0ABZ2FGD0_9MICO|nr:hypothetical protein [Kytococcus sp.]HCE61298.1 hypothetical protein [Janibacter terrae]
MTSRTRATPFALTAVAALALTACGGDAQPAASGTSGEVTPSSSATTVEELTAPEQQQLTAAEIKRALPTREEAPRGFVQDTSGFDTRRASQRRADPQTCLAVFLDTPQMRTWKSEHLADGEGVRYTRNSGEDDSVGQPSISVAVYSYDEAFPTRFLDEAGAALADCATFRTAVSPGSEMSDWSATNIQTPVLGEQSLGVRAGSRELDSAIDYLWVRSGHNLVHVRMLTGFRADNSDILQEYAEGVLDDLA